MTDRNAFGGEFTPFRDMWQSMASDLGITTKRMRETAAERAAAEEAAWRDANDQLHGELRRQQALAYTPEDAAELATLETQATIADRMRQSPEQGVRDAGIRLLGDVMQAQRQFSQKQEADRIAAETLRDSNTLGAENLRFDRDMALSGALRRDVVSPFQQQLLSFNKAGELLATGDRLGYDFAFTMAIQALDGSVVREGERLAYTGSAGLTAQAVDLFNKWQGERSEETERQLRSSLGAMHKATVNTYQSTVDTYRMQAEAYGGDWSRVGSVVPEFAEWYGGAEAAGEASARARAAGELTLSDVAAFEPAKPSFVGKAVGAVLRGAQYTMDDARRVLEGSELRIAPDGTRYEVRPDGTVRAAGRENAFKDDQGNTLELVDRGDGRMDWRVLEQAKQRRTVRERILEIPTPERRPEN
jgi:hypothetical protein